MCIQDCRTWLWGGEGVPTYDNGGGQCYCVCNDERWYDHNLLGRASCVPVVAHAIFGWVGLALPAAAPCHATYELSRQISRRVLYRCVGAHLHKYFTLGSSHQQQITLLWSLSTRQKVMSTIYWRYEARKSEQHYQLHHAARASLSTLQFILVFERIPYAPVSATARVPSCNRCCSRYIVGHAFPLKSQRGQ